MVGKHLAKKTSNNTLLSYMDVLMKRTIRRDGRGWGKRCDGVTQVGRIFV